MMHTNLKDRKQAGEGGQSIILFTFFMIVLILFVGLGVDLGFAYITRARLSKAVDAACLTGIRSYTSSNVQGAIDLAKSSFRANYGQSGRDVGPGLVNPTTVAFGSANNNVTLDVSATTKINTYFIRVLPQWSTLTVGSSAQATRPNLIMSLALDRSGSMLGNGGSVALPPAVTTFIDLFDDQRDRAGMASFASDARTNDTPYYVSLRQPFQTDIKNAADTMPFGGGTFSHGGLTNAYVQIRSATIAPNEKVVKVCLFFTDGFANTIQQGGCVCTPDTPLKVLNFGGFDGATTCVGVFDPADGNQFGTKGCPPNNKCPTMTTFTSSDGSTQRQYVRADVTAEGELRCVQIANQMRLEQITVYAIGMGNNINQTFLKQVANDPSVPGYVQTPYDGAAVFAPSSAQLQDVFIEVANKILGRLTR